MTYLLGLQPVIVPAGRMSLGRIFNVVGAIIDRYLGLSFSFGMLQQHISYGMIYISIGSFRPAICI